MADNTAERGKTRNKVQN